MATGYGGTYKAVVLDALDPAGQHRLSVRVPDVGIDAEWARPLDGNAALPAVGDEVFVQFEGGDTDYPVWHRDGAAAPASPRYAGVYRATVVDNVDPMQNHRIKVEVPEVLGNASMWANPGPALGSAPEIPEVGSGVWVEFEGGSPDYPQWTGVQ